jgi:FAD/FMN-containing dehydrogenase
MARRVTVLLNDVHSALNPTRMARVAEVGSPADVLHEVERARLEGTPVIAAGGRHAMGGQQFLENGVLIDTRPLRAVRSFDRSSGVVEVEAGIQWPDLIGFLTGAQDPDDPERWTIIQKQSGFRSRAALTGSRWAGRSRPTVTAVA